MRDGNPRLTGHTPLHTNTHTMRTKFRELMWTKLDESPTATVLAQFGEKISLTGGFCCLNLYTVSSVSVHADVRR